MVKKTKKNNKRIYSGKKTRIRRKMVGGKQEQPVQNDSILQKMGSVGSQIVGKGLDYFTTGVAKLTGTNPNEGFEKSYENLTNKATNIINVVADTNLGNELGEKLADATEKITKPVVSEVTEIANDFAKKEIPVVGDMANNAIKVIPVVGQVVAATEEGLDIVQSLENTAEAATKATGVGIEQMEALKDAKESISDTFEKIGEVASSGLENVENKLEEGIKAPIISANEQINNNLQRESLNNNLQREGLNNNLQRESLNNNLQGLNNNLQRESLNNNLQRESLNNNLQGDSLKKIQKESKMIGGRVSKSKLEFLTPFKNNKILKKYGGKVYSKRLNNQKRNVTLRKYK